MPIHLKIKPFSFKLLHPLKTAQGLISKKSGWLVHLAKDSGQCGWGEISPLDINHLRTYEEILHSFSDTPSRKFIEEKINEYQGAIGFGLGAALAELDGLVGLNSKQKWLSTNISTFLLPTSKCPLNTIEKLVKKNQNNESLIFFKWKVANQNKKHTQELLTKILNLLPENSRLRIDANGGWSRQEAEEWVIRLRNESRVEWLEQPLPANDIEGLSELSNHLPIALDESLTQYPDLRRKWKNWQIRRPALDGDPRFLLNELNTGISHRAISTAFETGIGHRWVSHLAVLQQQGPTPTAPGLAPGWRPSGKLFNNNPSLVWDAA